MRSITTLCTRRVLHIATVLTVALHAAKAHLHSREAAQIEPIVVPPSGYWYVGQPKSHHHDCSHQVVGMATRAVGLRSAWRLGRLRRTSEC